MKIYMIGDEPIVLESWKKTLASGGFEALLVPTVKEAFDVPVESEVAPVIIDINMPERDCLFLMDEFSERRKEIPMLMMSDYHIAETVEEVTRRGAADFLSTPFTPDEFFQAVRGVIRKEEIHGST